MTSTIARAIVAIVAAGTASTAYALVPVGGATVIPAYGSITIRDTGTGATISTTFTSPNWDCSSNVGSFPITVTCEDISETLDFNCPQMVVNASATGAVKGTGRCTSSTSTGDVVASSGTARGNLGAAPLVRCTASGVEQQAIPIPPYTVSCLEPGLPG